MSKAAGAHKGVLRECRRRTSTICANRPKQHLFTHRLFESGCVVQIGHIQNLAHLLYTC